MRRGGVDVVVPSFRRPVALGQCLAGLAAQERAPDRILVAARPEDTPTWDVAADASRHLPVVVVPVDEAGLVPALVAGVAATQQPRVAFTDDDAIPHPHWLQGLIALLDEPGVGVAGGRDLVPGELEPRRHNVGTLASWGRFSGDHHLGRGPARDVHVVKGVNMAFREDALAVPRPDALQGVGTQMHTEEMMCAWARARGWRVRYDPAVTVDHRVLRDEALAGPDHRRNLEGRRAGAHNRMLGTIAADPDRAGVHVAYGLLVGSREAPGVARALWALARGEREVLEHARASFAGTWAGARDDFSLDDAMLSCAILRKEHSACG
jgi:glycosyltransferase involved in cell wall biosynthesis